MTRKDYVAIADALAEQRPDRTMGAYDVLRCQWNNDVAAITKVLAADNPRFDAVRFVAACEGK